MGVHNQQVMLRVSKDILSGVDHLIPKIQTDPELAAWGRVTRSSVIRLAILHGLKVLQEKYGA